MLWDSTIECLYDRNPASGLALIANGDQERLLLSQPRSTVALVVVVLACVGGFGRCSIGHNTTLQTSVDEEELTLGGDTAKF